MRKRSITLAQVDAQGRGAPDSVWQAWEDSEFGQKRETSLWVTFIVLRILSRVGDSK